MAIENRVPHLCLQGVTKRYGGITALNNVDLAVHKGRIHALLGENGAGKSTLIKVVSGVVPRDSGRITLNDREIAFSTPRAANEAGVVCVFQELSLMPHLSVAENISIARPPRRYGLIDTKAQIRLAESLLARIGCADIDPRSRVGELSLSRRQMVEIAKALGKEPELLILDEATSALTHRDVELFFEVLHGLRAQNLSILYVSHRMHEIEILADRLSVFRNGSHVASFDRGEHDEAEIVEMMIGREITTQYPTKPAPKTVPPFLEVSGLSWGNGALRDLSFTAGKGEIVGLGGLDGQGQTQLLLALFGVLKGVTGSVRIGAQAAGINSPQEAKNARDRIAMIPEDRKTEGLMLAMSVADNLISTSLDRVCRGPFISEEKARDTVNEAIRRLRIKIGDPSDPAWTLSGGNQQKVVIAKWLMIEPEIILLNDPTRGIDVGTKQEIYQLLRALADAGATVVMYSSDYDELIGCCDRVEVMYDGRIVATLSGESLTEQALVSHALNLGNGVARSKEMEST
ncbi:sugar ABC transporter ATP-binding protein [Propionivibrio soli]|uniref:sugar ABC transporter ATP-binding protein n=1 Tax=Propionivibrio soli TaxID=2976531 RepID=UPI0021E82D43|nr:sugar ABC transporter ATP-binding protein [Propionivibrio soli]